jgi:hypothetical protein
MTTFSTTIHQDQNGIKTSSQYGDRGDAIDDWFLLMRAADGADSTQGAMADAAVEGGATSGSIVALLKGLQKALGVNTDASAPSGNGYSIPLLKAIRDTLRLRRPSDATWMAATSGNVANTNAVATLAGSASVTNYLSGVEITFCGATGASNVIATITGLLGGTKSFVVAVPAGINTQGESLIIDFDPPLPASAANTAITVTLPALGAGNTHACVNAHGLRM